MYILENRKLLAASNKSTQSCRSKYIQAATSELLSFSIYIIFPFLITSIMLAIMIVKLIQVTLILWRLIQQMKKAMKYVHVYFTYTVNTGVF